MPAAMPDPHEEIMRLAALYELNIMDTSPEERYDIGGISGDYNLFLTHH